MVRLTRTFAVLALAALPGCDTVAAWMPGAGQPAASQDGAPATSNAWRARLDPRIPYLNLGSAPVPVYSDARLTQPAGSLPTGAGGRIETCLDAVPVCRIAYEGTSLWVRIARLSGVAG